MDYVPSRDVQSRLNFLKVYQIAGGVMGVVSISQMFFRTTVLPISLIAILSVIISLYAFSMYTGILLFKRKLISVSYSVINQYLQLIAFKISGFALSFISGIYITAGIDITKSFNFLFGMGVAKWAVAIDNSSRLFVINFNFVALAMIIFIDKLKNQIAQEKTNNFVEQIAI